MNTDSLRLDSKHSVADLADSASSAFHEASLRAGDMADRASHSLRDGADRLQSSARRAGHNTTAYMADEPVKSLLIAAAAGAVLMGLVSLFTRSRH